MNVEQSSKITKPTVVEGYAHQYAALRDRLPGQDQPWLRDLREQAIETFRTRGLPTRRDEVWKYTSLRALEKAPFEAAVESGPVSLDRAPRLLTAVQGAHHLVFVNGRFRPELSSLGDLPRGVTVKSLATAVREDADLLQAHLGQIADDPEHAMLALNTALMSDGLLVHVQKGAVVGQALEIVHIAADGDAQVAAHPRNLFVLEPGSDATVVEHYTGFNDDQGFVNVVNEVSVGDGARFHLYKLQAELAQTIHIAGTHATLGRDSLLDLFSMTTGGQLSRNEAHVRLAGEGADCRINGAYMVRGKQHCDNTTLIEHLVPHTTCSEVFKGAIDEQARAVFQGRIIVHPHAQKSNAHQLSKALLLSETAEIDAKPQLEIHADDVMCSHGAAAGDLDRDALFYLRARGLPYESARRMLIEAFLGEAVDQIATRAVCPALMSCVAHWLTDR